MNRICFAIIERTLRLFGLDAHVQLDDSGLGLFALERRDYGGGNCELWGLGLHVAAGPIRPNKTPQAV